MRKNKHNEIINNIGRIYDDSIRIKYLLESAIYKPDEERETFVLGELAIKLAQRISRLSKKISSACINR